MINHCPICNNPKDSREAACKECLEILESECFDSFMSRCPVCHYPKSSDLYGCSNCKDGKGHSVYPVARYDGKLGYSLVYAFKFLGKKEMAKVVAFLMSKALEVLDPQREAILVPIPCSDSRLEKYGWDPMIEVCRNLDLPFVSLISNNVKNAVQQKTLGKKERVLAATGKFRLSESYRDSLDAYKERKVIVVDDVSTTGTTLSSAVELLESNGFSDVSAAVWLCDYLPTGNVGLL